MLFFSRSQTFEHSPITRPKNDQDALSFAEKFMIDFGKKYNMEVTCSKDGGLFTPEGLAKFDVIMFYTTGQLEKAGQPQESGPVQQQTDARRRQAGLLDAIAGGKGFLGVHSATDTFDKNPGPVDPYIEMIGGEFVIHHQQEKCEIQAASNTIRGTIKDLKHSPSTKSGTSCNNIAPDLHVLLVQNTKSMNRRNTTPSTRTPKPGPAKHGKGRVFYTSMGHRCSVDAARTTTKTSGQATSSKRPARRIPVDIGECRSAE